MPENMRGNKSGIAPLEEKKFTGMRAPKSFANNQARELEQRFMPDGAARKAERSAQVE